MGKLGKKARKFAKKNLQSAEKRNRKQKPFLKRKFAKRDGRRNMEDAEEKKIEQPRKKRCLEVNSQDIVIDAVFDKDENVALDGGDSDSDGYLPEQSKSEATDHPMQLVDETESDTMRRKVLSGSVLSSCCDRVDEEQSVQALISLLNWYRAACHYGHEPSGYTSPDIYYDIEDSETFAKVMILCSRKLITPSGVFWDYQAPVTRRRY